MNGRLPQCSRELHLEMGFRRRWLAADGKASHVQPGGEAALGRVDSWVPKAEQIRFKTVFWRQSWVLWIV